MAIKNRSTAGVYITEVDDTPTIAPVSTSIGATVVRSKRGPVNRPVLVNNDTDYVSKFGEPIFTSGSSVSTPDIPEMGYGQYAALKYSRESDAMYVVRDYDTGDTYSNIEYEADGSTSGTETSGVQAIPDPDGIPDDIDIIYSLNDAITTGNSMLIGPLGPGLDGNNIAITVETFHSGCDWFNTYDDYTSATDTSAHPIGSQVFKIDVFTKKDSESWNDITYASVSASPAESWYGTRASVQDDNKKQLKISDVVNGNSELIYVVAGTADFTSGGTLAATPSSLSALVGGNLIYGTNLGSTDGWEFFTSREKTSQNIMIVPDSSMTVKKYVTNIAVDRKDCIAVGQSGQLSDGPVAKILAAETYGYSNPSYNALYGGYDKFYDNYNDKYVFLPKAIYGAGLMARTDAIANVWNSPAGVNRGILDSDGQKVQYDFDQVGQLSDANINTSLNKKGYGDVMWAQKTAQLKASDLSKINVRRELIFIESTLEQSYLPFIEEPNNSGTRLKLTNISEIFLEDISSNGGFNTKGDTDLGFKLVCDITNNPLENETLYVSLFLRPIKTVEFIELVVTLTPAGVSFTEVI